MSNPRKPLGLVLGMAGLSIVAAARGAIASSFGLSYTDGGSWNTNYAQGFSPSVAPNPDPALTPTDPVYLNRFQFFKSGTPDSASNIRLVILNGMFADLTNLNTSSASVIGLSTNTVPNTTSLVTGNPITFTFNDLALVHGNNYATMFANVGGGGELTPVLVSSLTANYVDIGGGQFHPQTNYGGETGDYWNYSVSNFYHTDAFGTYFDTYSWGGDANFAATLGTTAATKWNVAGSGNWNDASNWTAGVPNQAGAPALFGSGATGAATVTTDVNVLAGTIQFDNASSYTVAGSNALTLDVTGGWGWVGANAGSHSISAPVSLADNSEFAVAAGSSLAVSNLQPSAVQVLKTGAGTLAVNNVRANGLTVSAGTVQILPNSTLSGTSRLTNLTIAAGARLDLTDNKVVTGNAVGTYDGSAYTGVTGQVAAGRNAGAWDGSGIVTSMTSATTSNFHSIGVAMASDVRPETATATGLWAGQTIAGADTLIMYTYGGDANLDGKINIDDYVRIDQGIASQLTGWTNGDFNYDGKVNIDDYTTIIDSNIGNQNGFVFPTAGGIDGAVSAVPEPAALSLLLAVGLSSTLRLRPEGPLRGYRRRPRR